MVPEGHSIKHVLVDFRKATIGVYRGVLVGKSWRCGLWIAGRILWWNFLYCGVIYHTIMVDVAYTGLAGVILVAEMVDRTLSFPVQSVNL